MGGSTSVPETVNVEEIMQGTGLSKKQVAALWTRFNELDCDARGESKGFKGYLDADDFGRVPKFDENPIAPRLIKVIFDDFGDDEKLTFTQFVHFMSTFGQTERHKHRPSIPMAMTSSKTDQEKVKFSADDSPKLRKIKFMFRMYDIDRDGHLSHEDIQETLKMMVGKISDEEASLIAEKVLGEFIEEQPNAAVTLQTFQDTLRTLGFNDKMGLKLLK